jgi:hypothetical protein
MNVASLCVEGLNATKTLTILDLIFLFRIYLMIIHKVIETKTASLLILIPKKTKLNHSKGSTAANK